MNVEAEKRLVGDRAAELVDDGMRVGLGTGSTVAYLLEAIARRHPKALFVATSPATAYAARALGIRVESFDELDELDLAIDGADQIVATGWLVKGGGGAHTREKIVAHAAHRFVVIADSTKMVDQIRPPIPLELSSFGIRATLRHLHPTALRDVAPSPDGGLIADYHGEVVVASDTARWLSSTPGVVEHGLFSPELVSEIIIATGRTVSSTRLEGGS